MEPVSYTHLQKRSVLHGDDPCTAFSRFGRVGYHDDCLVPVSYTHLDVYKRQVWSYPEDYGSCEAADVEPVQRLALDESDIVTFHQYEGIERVKRVVSQLKKENRPMMNTEWLNRVQDNFIQDNLPLYYEEGIGSYSWGLVAGKSQHFLPWDELWNHRELPLNRWQHDLFDTFFTAYDEEELELMRTYRKKSEESCQRKE